MAARDCETMESQAFGPICGAVSCASDVAWCGRGAMVQVSCDGGGTVWAEDQLNCVYGSTFVLFCTDEINGV